MVTAEEGGIFELSDKSRVEIPPNSLSRDATLYIAKINLEPQDTSDFNSEIIYEVKIIERTVNILQPFKLFLPIPLGIDTSNVSVLRFDNDNNFEFINGNIGLKSVDNFIRIDSDRSGTYSVRASNTDEDDAFYKKASEIVYYIIEANEKLKDGSYDWISSQYQKVKQEEQALINRMENSPGLVVEDVDDMVYESVAISGLTAILWAIPSGVTQILAAVITVVSGFWTIFKLAKVLDDTNTDLIISYFKKSLEVKVITFFYEKIGLDVWADANSKYGKEGPAPLEVECDGEVEEGAAKPITYYWDFDNGYKSDKFTRYDSIKPILYAYENPGKYTPVLYVEDANGKKGQAEGGEITVTPPDPVIPDRVLKRIEVLPSTMTIDEGDSQTISSITAYYSDDSTKNVSLTDPNLVYSNLSTEITSVDNGKITGKKEGKVSIRIFYSDNGTRYDDLEVTVIPDVELERIEILPSTMTIDEGDSQTISSIKAYYSDSTTKSVSRRDSDLDYDSLNSKVATVSNGKITAKKGGTATIKVYYQDRGVATDKVAVTVLPHTTKVLERISVYPASMSLGQGDYQYISSIKAYYSDNTSENIFLSNPNLEYVSLSSSVADVDGNGKVSAIKPGSATIRVSYTDGVKVNDTVAVTVGGGIDPPESVDASIGASIWIYIWWDSVNGATHYKLYRATSETGTKTAISDWQTDTSFTDDDVIQGTTYYYFVKAATSETGANASTYSSYCIGFTVPPAPTGVSASQGTSINSVSIIWNSASLATHYQVYRATSETGTKTAISDWQTDTSFADDDVIQGTTYYYFVKAAYYDSGSYYDSAYSSYAIGHPKPEDGNPPVIFNINAPSSVEMNETTTITCNASDPDDDPLTYAWTKTGGTFEGSTTSSSIIWRAPSTQGTYTISCEVSDGKGGEDSESVSISVGGNHPPVISNINAPSSVEINQTTTITCNASDPDDDPLTYAWTKTGGIFEGSTTSSSIIWRAPSTQGTYTISCEVSDGEASDSKSVNISVGDNHAPIITSDPITTATVDEPYHYDVNATDPDGDTLTYSFARPEPYRPAGTIINPSTGLFTWTPQNDGVYDFIVKVEDDGSPVLSDTQSFEITVAPNTDPDPEALDPPTGVSASDGTYDLKVRITWNSVPGATHYRVYRSTSPEGTKTALTSYWITNTYYDNDFNVSACTTYYYWVKASHAGDNISDYSDYDTGWRKFQPPVLSASDGTYPTRVHISWWTGDMSSSPSHYRVYRATSPEGTKTALGSWQTSSTYDDYDVTSGTIYYYWVKAASSSAGDNASDFSDYDSGYSYINEEDEIEDMIYDFFQALSNQEWNKARSYCIYGGWAYEEVNDAEDQFYLDSQNISGTLDRNYSISIGSIIIEGEYAYVYGYFTETTLVDGEIVDVVYYEAWNYLQKIGNDWKML